MRHSAPGECWPCGRPVLIKRFYNDCERLGSRWTKCRSARMERRAQDTSSGSPGATFNPGYTQVKPTMQRTSQFFMVSNRNSFHRRALRSWPCSCSCIVITFSLHHSKLTGVRYTASRMAGILPLDFTRGNFRVIHRSHVFSAGTDAGSVTENLVPGTAHSAP